MLSARRVIGRPQRSWWYLYTATTAYFIGGKSWLLLCAQQDMFNGRGGLRWSLCPGSGNDDGELENRSLCFLLQRRVPRRIADGSSELRHRRQIPNKQYQCHVKLKSTVEFSNIGCR